MSDASDCPSHEELAEVERLMKQLDEQKRESAIAKAQREAMKRMEAEVQTKVTVVKAEVNQLRHERQLKDNMLKDDRDKAALTCGDAVNYAARLQRIKNLMEAKKRVMQKVSAEHLNEMRQKTKENQERMYDAPWIPEHNKLVEELHVVTSDVDALKSEAAKVEGHVSNFEGQLRGHSKLHFKNFVFKMSELVTKNERVHSALCTEIRQNEALKRKQPPRSQLDLLQVEEPPMQPSQQAQRPPQEDLDRSAGSDPVRTVRIDEQDESMETDEPAVHNLSSADNGVLRDTNDSLADLDLTECDVAYGRVSAAGPYQRQEQMDTSLMSELDEDEPGGNDSQTEDDPHSQFVESTVPAAALRARFQHASSVEVMPEQGVLPPKAAPVKHTPSPSGNREADMRPYSSEAAIQTPPRKGVPQDVEKRQKRTEMAQQQRSATPSRPVHPQDRDASPRATASTTASRSPSGEPCTPINAERPPVVAKTPSKPGVFRPPLPPKTPQPPQKNKQQPRAAEQQPPHQDTPIPAEKKKDTATLSSDHSKFSFSFGDDAGGEDDANGSMFSFGFGDAGNDNNMSFMNGNNGAADALVNISLRSAGSANDFLHMMNGNDASAANNADGGFEGFDFGFDGGDSADNNNFFANAGDGGGTDFLNMSQAFAEGSANDDVGFNFGF